MPASRTHWHPWTLFQETSHRIYTTVAVPTEPWQQVPHSAAITQLPWTEVLDYACNWAAGASTLDDAGSRTTYAVYHSGLVYDCIDTDTNYTEFVPQDLFCCTDFLDLLTNNGGRQWQVNCIDCAAILSTFANSLGCDLWQSQIVAFFELNHIRVIGWTQDWERGCHGWVPPEFDFHEVAWKGACDIDDRLFDACLEVDASNAAAGPHIGVLPLNMRFGVEGDGEYRDRLAAPVSRANCNPDVTSRKRRAVV